MCLIFTLWTASGCIAQCSNCLSHGDLNFLVCSYDMTIFSLFRSVPYIDVYFLASLVGI
jgi:hypothetical protein